MVLRISFIVNIALILILVHLEILPREEISGSDGSRGPSVFRSRAACANLEHNHQWHCSSRWRFGHNRPVPSGMPWHLVLQVNYDALSPLSSSRERSL